MKKIFFTVLVSFLSAQACPDLSGIYTCGYDQNSGEPNKLTIYQDDAITYRIKLFGSNNELTFTANDKILSYEDETYSQSYLTSCPADTASLQFKSNLFHKIENWTQVMTSTFIKTAENKIDFIIDQDIFKKDKDTHFSVNFHCKKN